MAQSKVQRGKKKKKKKIKSNFAIIFLAENYPVLSGIVLFRPTTVAVEIKNCCEILTWGVVLLWQKQYERHESDGFTTLSKLLIKLSSADYFPSSRKNSTS